MKVKRIIGVKKGVNNIMTLPIVLSTILFVVFVGLALYSLYVIVKVFSQEN